MSPDGVVGPGSGAAVIVYCRRQIEKEWGSSDPVVIGGATSAGGCVLLS